MRYVTQTLYSLSIGSADMILIGCGSVKSSFIFFSLGYKQSFRISTCY